MAGGLSGKANGVNRRLAFLECRRVDLDNEPSRGTTLEDIRRSAFTTRTTEVEN
jgi:hypothetical protein